jgi:hypothetical protein
MTPNGPIAGWLVGWMDLTSNGPRAGWLVGWMDLTPNGPIAGWLVGWMDLCLYVSVSRLWTLYQGKNNPSAVNNKPYRDPKRTHNPDLIF